MVVVWILVVVFMVGCVCFVGGGRIGGLWEKRECEGNGFFVVLFLCRDLFDFCRGRV